MDGCRWSSSNREICKNVDSFLIKTINMRSSKFIQLLIVSLIVFSSKMYAQYIGLPAPPPYAIVSSAGATLAQIVDTMYAHANTGDTTEGGEMERINEFKRIWEPRVVIA